MEQRILNDGEEKGVIRGKINDNFSELYAAAEENSTDISALQAESESNAANISALQSDKTAIWETLNRTENRSNANETAIAELREILSRNGIV